MSASKFNSDDTWQTPIEAEVESLRSQLAETRQQLEQAMRVVEAAKATRRFLDLWDRDRQAKPLITDLDVALAPFTSASGSEPAKPPQPPQR